MDVVFASIVMIAIVSFSSAIACCLVGRQFIGRRIQHHEAPVRPRLIFTSSAV